MTELEASYEQRVIAARCEERDRWHPLIEEITEYMIRLYREAAIQIADPNGHDSWFSVAETLEKLSNCTALQSLKLQFQQIRMDVHRPKDVGM
jgi:hypothetical protein